MSQSLRRFPQSRRHCSLDLSHRRQSKQRVVADTQARPPVLLISISRRALASQRFV